MARVLVAALILAALPVTAFAATNTTYVSGTGNDASNNCASAATPCKTLQKAYDNTNPGGEIDCVGPGFVGTLPTINKSITIDCFAYLRHHF